MSNYHLHHRGETSAHSVNSVSNHEHHDHQINYEQLQKKGMKILMLVIGLVFLFAFVEAMGGYVFNSLALLSDAAHMFTDSFALMIALLMAYLSKKPADNKHSYGYGRFEVLGALFNSVFMIGVIVAIVWQAIIRINNPLNVSSLQMVVVAVLGLIINIVSLFVLSKESDKNINIKAAWLHVFGDLLGSIAAIVGGLIIYFTSWNIVDPLLSLLIAFILIPSTVSLLIKSINILKEGVPVEISYQEVGDELSAIKEFVNIHDLHIWALDSKNLALSVHVVLVSMDDWVNGLSQAQKMLAEKFNITHVTIQPEIKITGNLKNEQESVL